MDTTSVQFGKDFSRLGLVDFMCSSQLLTLEVFEWRGALGYDNKDTEAPAPVTALAWGNGDLSHHFHS